jgi:hypothetical protein
VGKLPVGHFRNLGSANPRIGASQVTAVIEHQDAGCEGPTYDINFAAELVSPYCVQLTEPVPLSQEDLRGNIRHADRLRSANQWMSLLSSLKQDSARGRLATSLSD